MTDGALELVSEGAVSAANAAGGPGSKALLKLKHQLVCAKAKSMMHDKLYNEDTEKYEDNQRASSLKKSPEIKLADSLVPNPNKLQNRVKEKWAKLMILFFHSKIIDGLAAFLLVFDMLLSIVNLLLQTEMCSLVMDREAMDCDAEVSACHEEILRAAQFQPGDIDDTLSGGRYSCEGSREVCSAKTGGCMEMTCQGTPDMPIDEEANCLVVMGCSWDKLDANCIGNPIPCNELPMPKSLHPPGTTCKDVVDLSDGTECEAEEGCVYTDPADHGDIDSDPTCERDPALGALDLSVGGASNGGGGNGGGGNGGGGNGGGGNSGDSNGGDSNGGDSNGGDSNGGQANPSSGADGSAASEDESASGGTAGGVEGAENAGEAPQGEASPGEPPAGEAAQGGRRRLILSEDDLEELTPQQQEDLKTLRGIRATVCETQHDCYWTYTLASGETLFVGEKSKSGGRRRLADRSLERSRTEHDRPRRPRRARGFQSRVVAAIEATLDVAGRAAPHVRTYASRLTVPTLHAAALVAGRMLQHMVGVEENHEGEVGPDGELLPPAGESTAEKIAESLGAEHQAIANITVHHDDPTDIPLMPTAEEIQARYDSLMYLSMTVQEISLGILLVFLAESVGLLIALRKEFFKEGVLLTDLLVVCGSIFANLFATAEQAFLLILLRFWRFARVFHGIHQLETGQLLKEKHLKEEIKSHENLLLHILNTLSRYLKETNMGARHRLRMAHELELIADLIQEEDESRDATEDDEIKNKRVRDLMKGFEDQFITERMMVEREKQERAAFKTADEDGSGEISKIEFISFGLGDEAMFDAIDVDKSGFINFEEFQDHHRQIQKMEDLAELRGVRAKTQNEIRKDDMRVQQNLERSVSQRGFLEVRRE